MEISCPVGYTLPPAYQFRLMCSNELRVRQRSGISGALQIADTTSSLLSDVSSSDYSPVASDGMV
jgi:hypothetical protein